MALYIIRRILYTIPVWIGVLLITFVLFHSRDPLAIARVHYPQAPKSVLENWVRNNNFHLPKYLNLPHHAKEVRPDGRVHPEFAEKSIFYSQFFLTLADLATFDFGVDKNKKPIGESILERIGPSLSIMLPAFLITVSLSILIALFVAYYRDTVTDTTIVLITVLLMSIAMPAYLIAFNYIFGKILKMVPVYNHVLLPIIIAVFSGIGGQIRFYRTVFLEQMDQDFVRTARAKGVSEPGVLIHHVLPNSMIPILTSVVMALPFLITGSLLLEQFFGIPGMGDFLFSAIVGQDFQVIKAVVYLGSFLYMIGSLMTDISYTLADPRVVLK